MNYLLAEAEKWVNAGLAFLFPEVCQLCSQRRATPAEGYVCAECQGQVKWIERPFCERCGQPVEGAVTVKFECANCRDTELHFRWARAAVAASGPVLEAIHRYKYNRALWVEPFLAGLLVRCARPELKAGEWHWIAPVPLHPTRQREREFNQAERLGRHLSKATGIPVNSNLLRRIAPTKTQTRLTREERRTNIRNAFKCVKSEALQGARILLVDDVLTTGATTGECARVLLRAGAGEVCVWTLARGV